MASFIYFSFHKPVYTISITPQFQITGFNSLKISPKLATASHSRSFKISNETLKASRYRCISNKLEADSNQDKKQDKEVNNLGVKTALSMLKFYKNEISPLLPKSCRYVPTCSEYSMIAYKKYGVVKGTVLTAWRICRCNPLGGSGFDPPRWFDEKFPPEELEEL